MHSLITDVAEKFGRIDVLINNAAGMGMKDGRVDELSLEEFNAVVATDLGGTFNMIKAVSYTHLDVYKRQLQPGSC